MLQEFSVTISIQFTILFQKSYEVNVSEIVLMPKLTVVPTNSSEEVIKTLVELGADVNAEDDFGRTPFLIAVENNNIAMMDALLNNKANINSSCRCGTPLHHAVLHSSLETVQYLLSKGANVNSLDRFHSTPLHVASKSGRIELIELFLDHGARIDTENSTGFTALDLAASCGSIDVFELFDRKGVDICTSENKSFRLLSIAVECKHDPLALWILNKEATLHHVGKRSLISRFLPASVSLCISICFCACLPFLMY